MALDARGALDDVLARQQVTIGVKIVRCLPLKAAYVGLAMTAQNWVNTRFTAPLVAIVRE